MLVFDKDMYKYDFYFVKDNKLWIRVPKNASTTIRATFDFNGWDRFNKSDIDFSKITKSFMICRNPFDRLVSCWFDRVGFVRRGGIFRIPTNPFLHNTSFEMFIKGVCTLTDEESDHHFRSQSWFVENVDCDYEVIKIEEINDNWDIITNVLGEKVNTFTINKKKSKREEYQTYYNSELIELVEKRYNKDLKLFNYSY